MGAGAPRTEGKRVKITRSSNCSLKFATHQKRQELERVLAEYGRVVNVFIDHFWTNGCPPKAKLLKPVVDIPQTWLTARLRKVAAREAIDMVTSAQKASEENRNQLEQTEKSCRAKAEKITPTTCKKRFQINRLQRKANKTRDKLRDLHPTKPVHKGKRMNVSCTIADLQEPKKTDNFDAWLHLASIGDGIILDLPVKFHKHFNELRQSGKRLNAYIITRDSVQFAFEQETGPKKQVQHLVGVDSGINALASLSDGQQLGTDIKECVERTKRCQWGSKGHGRAQRALKQRIDETAKELVSQPYELVVVEKIGGLSKLSKVTRRVTKSVRRSIGSWNYRYWLDRLEQQCERNRVSFRTVSPAYTSQKCSGCGHTNRSNRHGEKFKCQLCGLAGNADINAALNILGRFLSGKYGSRYKPLCSCEQVCISL